eukprot:scaffold24130_cov142-Cylindrotheca_fusiformis.AAC.3
MDETSKRKSSEIEEELAPEFFVYTSETKHADLPKATLTHLRVDSSVSEIPRSAFMYCKALLHVQLPETLTRIDAMAFNECSNLKRVQFVSSVSSTETSSIDPDLEDGLIVFPEKSTIHVGYKAFAFCSSLRKLIVCSASTQFATGAFRLSNGLTSVELPEGIQVIETDVFYCCESLETVKIPSTVITIRDDAFFGCSSLTSVDIPAHGLLKIGDGSFDCCLSMRVLQIPATVSTIGKRAFASCCTLRRITLPPILERIEALLFNGCENLEFIEIPPTVTEIGDMAFFGCAALSHIRIPQSVNSIGHDAFLGCYRVISIELPAENSLYMNLSAHRSLVNIVIPSWEEDMVETIRANSRLNRVADGYRDLDRRLRYRFDNSPLNELCYYQSYRSVDDLETQFRRVMENDPLAITSQVDEFGMTPLHVLALSHTPNLGLLLAVIQGGNLDHIIRGRDSFGATPMDYLCSNQMPYAAEVIRRVLQARFPRYLSWDRSLVSNPILRLVDEALEVDIASRGWEIVSIYLKIAKYERKDICSIVELFLWKVKIDEVGSRKEQIAERQMCRINSGASIVIPHVLPFLDSLDRKDYVVWSAL